MTNNFNDVSVTGESGDANVYVAGDSGKMYFSFENGEEGTWEYVTPGSGSNINAVAFFDARREHIVDGNKTVFETDARSRPRDRSVLFSSVAGRRPFPGSAVYSGTEYFVRALSERMRNELAPSHNIRVTCIEPGAVDTERPHTITDEDILAMLEAGHDEMQMMASENIADTIRYALTAPVHVVVEALLVMPTERRPL